MNRLSSALIKNIAPNRGYFASPNFSIVTRESLRNYCSRFTLQDKGLRNQKKLSRLCGVLGLTNSNVSKIAVMIRKNNLSHNEFMKTAHMLQYLGASTGEIKNQLEVFCLAPSEIHKRATYLNEAGIAFSVNLIVQFEHVIKKTVNVLKAGGVLEKNVSVAQNLLSHVGTTSLEPLSVHDDQSLQEIHFSVLMCYVQHRLGIELSEAQLKVIDQCIPITHVVEIFNILEHHLKLGKEEIVENLEFLSVMPVEASNLLIGYGFPIPLDMPTVIRKHKPIFLMSLEKLHKALDILQRCKISAEQILECPEVLTVDPSYVEKMLKTIKDYPELKYVNPLKLLRLNHLQHRLAYLRKHKLPRPNWLGIPCGLFSSQTMNKISRRAFSEYLAKEMNISVDQIAAEMDRFPCWGQSSFSNIYNNLSMLRDLGYSDTEIIKHIGLLFYRTSQVMETLDRDIYSDKSIKQKREYDSRHLALCLYFIEKQNQFSWNIFPDSKRGGSGLQFNSEREVGEC